MELTGSEVVVAPVVAEGEESVPDAMQIAHENADMPTVMMSRKKRKLYEAMQVRTIHIYNSFFLSIVSIGLLNVECYLQIGKKKKKASVELIEQRKKRLNDAQS